ncbi:hypothetical protein [Hydrogenophaga sp.]|uniref:hypothetical protein n=1 Tax=Hydrogenophaga sp. TaxID=1904254 RepID=UPI003F6C431E
MSNSPPTLRAGSSMVTLVPAGKPKAALIWSSVMPSAIKVVSGVTMVEPAGAMSLPTKGSWVSVLVPPVTTRVDAQVAANLKKPVESVVVMASPASDAPFPLASQTTVAPLM